MSRELPLWRSLLFVPANVERFVARAPLCDADAIILDLEDGVPAAQKTDARQAIPDAVLQLRRSGTEVVVRINPEPDLARSDLQASIGSGVQAICLPKVHDAAQVRQVSKVIDKLEMKRRLPAGHTRLIAMIESVEALEHLAAIAGSSTRLVAMILGSEDFSASVGMEPDHDLLLYPNQQVLFAARQAGLLPLGLVGSITEFRDLPAFRASVRLSRRAGFRGAQCIHPDQVQILNEEFGPSDDEVQEARSLLEAFEGAQRSGRGSVEYNGRMIDAPVAARARELLSMNEKIVAHRSRRQDSSNE